jgi:hypothetical protein
MDKLEAHKILGEQLGRFTSYPELVPLAEFKRIKNIEVSGASGMSYRVEVQFSWYDRRRRIVGVHGSIDGSSIQAAEMLLVFPNGDVKI